MQNYLPIAWPPFGKFSELESLNDQIVWAIVANSLVGPSAFW